VRVVTLLNRIEKLKSFVYKKVSLEEVDGKEAVVIDVRPRKNSPPVYRVCMKRCGTHSTGRPRRFEHVPFWGWQVYLQYRPRHSVRIDRDKTSSCRREVAEAPVF